MCAVGACGRSDDAAPGTSVVGAEHDSSYSGGDDPPANTEYGRNPIIWR